MSCAPSSRAPAVVAPSRSRGRRGTQSRTRCRSSGIAWLGWAGGVQAIDDLRSGCRLTHVESTPLVATMESSRTHGPQQGAALMKRTTKYVALDGHQATTLASVREESGRVSARSILPTDGPALTEFFRGMRRAIRAAIEEGTQA